MKIIGIDVSKDYITLFDGESFFIYAENEKALRNLKLKKLQKVKVIKDLKEAIKEGDTCILEQTGSYGLRYAKKLLKITPNILIIDGKAYSRFRKSYNKTKDDLVDAYLIREMFTQAKLQNNKEFQKAFLPFDPIKHSLRGLIRTLIRTNKDLTRSVNRLKQMLCYVFPENDYYILSRKKLLKEKTLREIEERLKDTPTVESILLMAELEKIKVCLRTIKLIEKEIESIAKNHQDYEILRTFPAFGDKTIATLISYYLDISNFISKEGFIGYVLMGAIHEQSGISRNERKTDKSRSEVKALLYMVYMLSGKENSPLKPLKETVKTLNYGRKDKQIFIKFADKLLELVYLALKKRLTFQQVIDFKLFSLQKELERLSKKKNLDYFDLQKLQRLQAYLWAYQRIKEIVENKDISPNEGEKQAYFHANQNTANQQNTAILQNTANFGHIGSFGHIENTANFGHIPNFGHFNLDLNANTNPNTNINQKRRNR
ncbi:MAG: transposase [Desulfurobacteriaceae bacterium]